MSIISDDTETRIAQRLRLEREARGWSQGDLARYSGVSKAAISKIEREEVSPSAALLVRLAAAFDLTLAGLLIRAEGGQNRLIRAGEQPVWCDPETGYKRQQIFARPDHPLEIVRVDLPPGQAVALPAASYVHIRQIILVQTGELAITEAAQRHVLGPGDCLAFGPPSDVTLANETAQPCVYQVILVRG